MSESLPIGNSDGNGINSDSKPSNSPTAGVSPGVSDGSSDDQGWQVVRKKNPKDKEKEKEKERDKGKERGQGHGQGGGKGPGTGGLRRGSAGSIQVGPSRSRFGSGQSTPALVRGTGTGTVTPAESLPGERPHRVVVTTGLLSALSAATESVHSEVGKHVTVGEGIRVLPAATPLDGQKDVIVHTIQATKGIDTRRRPGGTRSEQGSRAGSRGGSRAGSQKDKRRKERKDKEEVKEGGDKDNDKEKKRNRRRGYGYTNRFGTTPAPSDKSWRRGASPVGSKDVNKGGTEGSGGIEGQAKEGTRRQRRRRMKKERERARLAAEALAKQRQGKHGDEQDQVVHSSNGEVHGPVSIISGEEGQIGTMDSHHVEEGDEEVKRTRGNEVVTGEGDYPGVESDEEDEDEDYSDEDDTNDDGEDGDSYSGSDSMSVSSSRHSGSGRRQKRHGSEAGDGQGLMLRNEGYADGELRLNHEGVFEEADVVGEGDLRVPISALLKSRLYNDDGDSVSLAGTGGDRTPTLIPHFGETGGIGGKVGGGRVGGGVSQRPYGAPTRSNTAPAAPLIARNQFAVLMQQGDDEDDEVDRAEEEGHDMKGVDGGKPGIKVRPQKQAGSTTHSQSGSNNSKSHGSNSGGSTGGNGERTQSPMTITKVGGGSGVVPLPPSQRGPSGSVERGSITRTNTLTKDAQPKANTTLATPVNPASQPQDHPFISRSSSTTNSTNRTTGAITMPSSSSTPMASSVAVNPLAQSATPTIRPTPTSSAKSSTKSNKSHRSKAGIVTQTSSTCSSSTSTSVSSISAANASPNSSLSPQSLITGATATTASALGVSTQQLQMVVGMLALLLLLRIFGLL